MSSVSIKVARIKPQDPAFILDLQDNVYVRPHSPPFAYSDWPTEYHFSATRHNLLRHLPIKRDRQILEIGAGCGSITRLFGETGAHIVALEGSFARARCPLRITSAKQSRRGGREEQAVGCARIRPEVE